MLPVEDNFSEQEKSQSVKQELEELRKQYSDLFVQVLIYKIYNVLWLYYCLTINPCVCRLLVVIRV